MYKDVDPVTNPTRHEYPMPIIGRRTNNWYLQSKIGLPSTSVSFLSIIRWVIPLVLALFGIGYIVLESLSLYDHALISLNDWRDVFMIGLVMPISAWLLLTWTRQVAVREAKINHELAMRNRELDILNAISAAVNQSLDLKQALQVALEKTVELIGAEAGEIRVIEDGLLVLKAQYGVSESQSEELSVKLGECLCGECAQFGKTLTLDDLPNVAALAHIPCARGGFNSIITIPMKKKEQVVGVLLLASYKQNNLGITAVHILNDVSLRIANAIENAQLYEKAYRRAIHLETASLLGQRMTALLELNPLLAEVVQLIRNKFGYDHVHIFLKDEATDEIVLQEASGASADLIKARRLRLKIGQQGITGWVAHTSQTLVCNDVSREPRYDEAELLPDTKSELAIPLRVGTQTIGVLDVQSDQCDAFDKEDITVLQILGNQIGIAIQNARLFQETRHRYNAMVALHETSLDMIAQLDTPKLLEALLRRGAQLLDAQAGSLFLYDADENSIRNITNYNTPRDWTGVIVHPGEGAIGQVIQTAKPIIVNDYELWQGRAEVFSGDPLRRLISVPLKWQDQVIGGINVLNELTKRPFDQNDVWLLSQFADLATLAIQNAELHTQVKEFSEDLEHKVEQRTQELSRAKNEIAIKAEQLRSLLAKTIEIQEAERSRIARDMHDGVMQLVNAARYELHAAELAIKPHVTAAGSEKLTSTYQVLEEIEKEIRRAIYDLHPPILDAIGLVPALGKYAQRFQELSGITCTIQVQGSPYRLPPDTELAVFRIVEEALQNVAAHASADSAVVLIEYEHDSFCYSVQDTGQGFDYVQWIEEHSGNHWGLLGMRERIKNLGGTMELKSEIGHGTRVTFQLPIVQDEELA